MPLPKPPAKRAALLDAADFDLQAAPKPARRAAKAAQGAASEPAATAELNLFDPRAATSSAAVTPPASRAAAAPPSSSCSTPTC